MAPRPASKTAQAWIKLRSEDPEAISALAVARTHLAAGRALVGLRRLRLMEIVGRLPDQGEIEELLHRSTQFYNPHKERCTVRLSRQDPPPIGAEERAVLVVDRGGARRSAAERWWLHETGQDVEVREATAWALSFEPGAPAAVEDLLIVRDRAHGLLCNPHAQECREAGDTIPLSWIEETDPARPARRRTARSAR